MKKLFFSLVATFVAISLAASDDIYSIDFTHGQGSWTINNVALDGMNSSVWTQSASYGMTASAYVKCAVESWLISPEIDLTNAVNPYISFLQAMKFGDASQFSVRARINGGEWITLNVSKWPTSDDFITTEARLLEFAGCSNVQIAFVYTSSTTNVGTWRIKSVTISSTIHKIGDLGYQLWEWDDKHTATVYSGINKNITEAIIPSTVEYDGKVYNVTDIGYYAFKGCNSLRTVVIGNNVTRIQHYAFWECDSINSLTISNSVVDVGELIFSYHHYHDVTIYFNGSLTDWCRKSWICGSYILYIDGNKIEDIKIPSEITNIKECCFEQCNSLKSVTIPNTVTSIGKSAFAQCKNLTSVTIPNSVTSIGSYAFNYCISLASVTLPNSITNIGKYVFQGCYSLISPIYNEYMFAYLPHYIDIEAYTIPEGIEFIAGGAFASCYNLASVEIPNSVTSIGDYAFEDCTGLMSLTIPNSITSIGDGAFYNVLNIIYSGTSTGAPWGAKSLNGYVEDYFVYNDSTKTQLLGCSSKAPEEIEIPNSVISVGNAAFSGCSALLSVTIPNSVTSIGDAAFLSCYNLASVIIPNSVTSIGDRVFAFCNNLSSVEIPNSVTRIGDLAFYACNGLTSIEIPNSVTDIGSQALEGCSNLTSVTIGEGVENIEATAFDRCISLNTITCYSMRPPSVTVRGRQSAFIDLDCSSIILYVPADYINNYQTHEIWGLFDVRPIGAESTETTEVIVTTSETTVEIAWPAVEGAATYELVIKDKAGNVICTLIFNASGQLTSIAFKAPSLDQAQQQPQTTGFSFTVTGLEEGKSYDLTITSKDNSGSTIEERVISFTTGTELDLEDVNISTTIHKILRDGQIFILRGDKVYTITGQEVK